MSGAAWVNRHNITRRRCTYLALRLLRRTWTLLLTIPFVEQIANDTKIETEALKTYNAIEMVVALRLSWNISFCLHDFLFIWEN